MSTSGSTNLESVQTAINCDAHLLSAAIQRILLHPSQATHDILIRYSRHSNFYTSLLHVLAQHPDSDVRHVASIIGRRRCLKGWSTLDEKDKPGARDVLLSRLMEEPLIGIRLNVSHIIGSLLVDEYAIWSDATFEAMTNSTLKESAVFRESCSNIWIDLLSSKHIRLEGVCLERCIFDIHFALSEDTNKRSLIAGLKCLETYLAVGYDPMLVMRAMESLPNLAYKIKALNGYSTLGYVLEVAGELTERPFLPDSAVLELVNFLETFLPDDGPSELPLNVLEQGVAFLSQAVEFRTAVLLDNSKADSIILKTLKLVFQKGENNCIQPYELVLPLYSVCARCLPPKKVYIKIRHELKELMTSKDAHKVSICLNVMSSILYPNSYIEKDIEELLSWAQSHCFNSDKNAAIAAVKFIGVAGQNLSDIIDIASMNVYKTFLEVFRCRKDVDVYIQTTLSLTACLVYGNPRAAGSVIHSILEVTADVVVNYKGNQKLLDAALGLYGCIAVSHPQNFKLYKDHGLTLIHLTFNSSEVPLEICATAVHTYCDMDHYLVSGEVSSTDGQSSMLHSSILTKMNEACKSKDPGSSQYRRAVYNYYCLLLERDNKVDIEAVICQAFASIVAAEGVKPVYLQDETVIGALDFMEDEEDPRRIVAYELNPTYEGEIEAALSLLLLILRKKGADHSKRWLSALCDVIRVLTEFVVPSIRELAITAAKELILIIHMQIPPDWLSKILETETRDSLDLSSPAFRSWTAGLPCKTPLAGPVAQLWSTHIWPMFREVLKNENKISTLTHHMNSLTTLLQALGPHIIEGDEAEAIENLLSSILLKREHTVYCRSKSVTKTNHDTMVNTMGDIKSKNMQGFLESATALLIAYISALGVDMRYSQYKLYTDFYTDLIFKSNSDVEKSVALKWFTENMKGHRELTRSICQKLNHKLFSLNNNSKDVPLYWRSSFVMYLGTQLEGYPEPATIEQLLSIALDIESYRSKANKGLTQFQVFNDSIAIAIAMLIRGHMKRGTSIGKLPKYKEVLPAMFLRLPLKCLFSESEVVVEVTQNLLISLHSPVLMVLQCILTDLLRAAVNMVASKPIRMSMPRLYFHNFCGIVATSLLDQGIGSNHVINIIKHPSIRDNQVARQFVNDVFSM